MSTGLKIGGIEVLKPGESETWSNSMLKQRILKRYGDDPVKDAVIEEVKQTTETTNEFLSTVNQRATAETGYDKYHLNDFEDLETPLEESVIDRIKEKLTQVQDFKVANM